MTAASLEDEGIRIAVAIDGLDGIRCAMGRPPTLVVLDMSLPGLDGVGVGEALRSRYGAGLPILVVTAGGGAAEKARRIGAFAYLHKPFDIRWLLEQLAQDAGFEVQMRATYDEALMRLAAQPVKAIVANCIDCGYLTLTRAIAHVLAQLASHAPIILHTARPWANDATIAGTLEVDSVVPKPTDFKVLLAALEHAFREH